MKTYKSLLYIFISAILTSLIGCTATQNPVAQHQTTSTNTGFVNPDIRGPQQRLGSRTNNSKRVALVIGNGAYVHEPTLANPTNDAVDVGQRLDELGFQVTVKTDLKRYQMRAVIAEFGIAATNAEAALFFYAGHAVQNHNQNFLLPIDITTNSIEDVTDQAINLNYPLAELDRARSKVNIIILDACRTPQFTQRFRGRARMRGEQEPTLGLAQIRMQPDTMIVYATEPGKGAVDSVGGRNSPFTTGLLLALRSRDLSLGGVLRTTSKQVVQLTKGYQVPYTNGPRILDDFQFAQAATQSVAATPIVTPTKPHVIPISDTSAQTQAETVRIAALEAKRKQEEARIARLKQEQIAAEQASQQARAEAARLAKLETQRKAEEARVARLERERIAAEKAAKARQEVMTEIIRSTRANFGGYSTSDPLKVYVMPFMSSDRFTDSEIGRIAWVGAMDGTKDIASFSDGRMKFVYNASRKAFENDLQRDSFWRDMRSGNNIKSILKGTVNRKGSNALIYGLYDGDDSSLEITVYLYARRYDVVFKKRYRSIETTWNVVMGLSRNKKAGSSLTYKQKALQRKIHEKVKLGVVRLLRQYMEGV